MIETLTLIDCPLSLSKFIKIISYIPASDANIHMNVKVIISTAERYHVPLLASYRTFLIFSSTLSLPIFGVSLVSFIDLVRPYYFINYFGH